MYGLQRQQHQPSAPPEHHGAASLGSSVLLQRKQGACLRAIDGNDNVLRSKARPAQRTLFFSAKTVHNAPNTPHGCGIGVQSNRPVYSNTKSTTKRFRVTQAAGTDIG